MRRLIRWLLNRFLAWLYRGVRAPDTVQTLSQGPRFRVVTMSGAALYEGDDHSAAKQAYFAAPGPVAWSDHGIIVRQR